MHHGQDDFPKTNEKLGPTNNFPQGKLNNQDCGEIRILIFTDKNKVIVQFGVPIGWIGMDKKQALNIAAMIKDKADLIEG